MRLDAPVGSQRNFGCFFVRRRLANFFPDERRGQRVRALPAQQAVVESVVVVNPMGPQEALKALHNDPIAFLTNNVVQTIGPSSLKSGAAQFCFWRLEGTAATLPLWQFTQYSPPPPTEWCIVPIHYISTDPATDIDPKKLDGSRLPETFGPPIMVTALLNGCSFVWTGENGDNSFPECAHIKPLRNGEKLPTSPLITGPHEDQGEQGPDDPPPTIRWPEKMQSGVVLQQDLERNQACFDDQPGRPVHIFGRKKYASPRTVCILGVLKGFSWHIYAQTLDKDYAFESAKRLAVLTDPAYVL